MFAHLIRSSSVGRRPLPTTLSISIWIFFCTSGSMYICWNKNAMVTDNALSGGNAKSVQIIMSWSSDKKNWIYYYNEISRSRIRWQYSHVNDAFSPSSTSSSFIFVRYMSIKWRSCDASYVWISLSTSSWNPLFAFQFLYFIPNSISKYLEITLKNEYSFIDDFSISSYSEVFGNNFATHSIILNNLPKLSPCLWNCNAWSEALRKQKIEHDLSNRIWWFS